MKNKLDKAFNIMLNEFDFEKVHKVMKFLNWQWAECGTAPSVVKMKDFVKKLYIDCIKECFVRNTNSMTISVGGFEFHIEKTEDNDVFMNLNFILENNDICVSEIEEEPIADENQN